MGNEEAIRMWVHPEFKKGVMKLKVDSPNKSIIQLTKDVGMDIGEGSFFKKETKKKGEGPFFGKI